MARRRRTNQGSLDLEFGKDGGLRTRVFAGVIAGVALIGAAGGWASQAELAGAVVAHGEVKVEKDLRAIQHLDGGIIREIAVKKGDVITKGQMLFRLDSTQTKAELQIIESQLTELIAKQARLMSERDGLEQMRDPADTLGLGVAGSPTAQGEIRLFQGNLKTRKDQKDQLALAIAQLDQEILGLRSQAEANTNELALVEAELKKVADLHQRGLIDNARVYSSTRERTRLLGDKGNIGANIARSLARHNELEISLAAIEETARTEAQKQLTEIDPRIAELAQRHRASTDKMSRMNIVSPLSGIVNEISVNTVGGVITPAQKLLTIVPENTEMPIEVKLSPGDIDQVYVGQGAKLRFSAFAVTQTPELHGKVEFVSPATSTDPNSGQVYYVAQLSVVESEMAKLGGKKLLPGMPVEAYIQTESRTALSYLAKPFTDQFKRAFREE